MPSSSNCPIYVGFRWRVVAITADDGNVAVPPDVTASVAFSPDGTVSLNDTINFITARFTSTASAVTFTNPTTTLARYAGDDPARIAVIRSFRAIVYSHQGAVVGYDEEGLTLGIPGTEVSLENDGPVSGTGRRLASAPSTEATRP